MSLPILNSNGFDFFKQKEYWKPIEAALIVSGFEESFMLSEEEFKKIEHIYQVIIKAFKNKKISTDKGIKVTDSYDKSIYKKYCHDFYEEDDVYDCGYLMCFKAVDYVRILIEEKTIKIPEELRLCLDDKGNYIWETNEYDPEEEISYYPPDEYPNHYLMKRVYEHYKGLSRWTILEAAALLAREDPRKAIKALNEEARYPDGKKGEILEAIERSIETDDLVFEIQGEKIYLSPFDFLEWAQKLWPVFPGELAYHYKKIGDNWEYHWKNNWGRKRAHDYCMEDNINKKLGEGNNILNVDMESNNLSEELKIALHAWNALYNSEGSFNPKFGHIDNIKKWIEKNYPKLPEAGKIRIAKVINLNKKGGATAINQI